MTKPAVMIEADRFAMALPKKGEDAARQLVEIMGSVRVQTLDMKGMGTNANVNDLSALSRLGSAQTPALVGQAVDREDVLSRENKIALELTRAFQSDVAAMQPMVAEIMLALSEGSDLTPDQKDALYAMVMDMAALKKMMGLEALPGGRERLEAMIAETAARLADMVAEAMDGQGVPHALADFIGQMVHDAGRVLDRPELAARGLDITGRIDPQSAMDRALEAALTHLETMRNGEDVSDEMRTEIDAMIESLTKAREEGGPLPADVLRGVESFLRDGPGGESVALQSALTALRNAAVAVSYGVGQSLSVALGAYAVRGGATGGVTKEAPDSAPVNISRKGAGLLYTASAVSAPSTAAPSYSGRSGTAAPPQTAVSPAPMASPAPVIKQTPAVSPPQPANDIQSKPAVQKPETPKPDAPPVVDNKPDEPEVILDKTPPALSIPPVTGPGDPAPAPDAPPSAPPSPGEPPRNEPKPNPESKPGPEKDAPGQPPCKEGECRCKKDFEESSRYERDGDKILVKTPDGKVEVLTREKAVERIGETLKVTTGLENDIWKKIVEKNGGDPLKAQEYVNQQRKIETESNAFLTGSGTRFTSTSNETLDQAIRERLAQMAQQRQATTTPEGEGKGKGTRYSFKHVCDPSCGHSGETTGYKAEEVITIAPSGFKGRKPK